MAMSFINVFIVPSRAGSAWFSAGLASSFPDITESGGPGLSGRHPCKQTYAPGSKVFQVPRDDSSKAVGVPLDEVDAPDSGSLLDQVLVFQYKGKFHAVNNKCPHASYPLSKATPFDIEDFGIVLSAGLTCPKHDWSFDMFTGRGDRGNYKLGIWEVQLRPIASIKLHGSSGSNDEESREEQEVWVRRKQRIG